MATLEELERKYFASGVPHLRDTQVIPHVDGQAYFAAVQEALDMAVDPEDVVYISAWAIHGGTILTLAAGRRLVEILHDKAALGMDVRLIVWTGRFIIGEAGIDNKAFWDTAFAVSAEKHGGIAGIIRNNITQVRSLRAFNPNKLPKPPLEACVLMDHGGGKWGSRHQKVVIVYHKATNDLRAFVAGIDIDPSRYAIPGHEFFSNWHDTGVELRGGAAMTVWKDFGDRWWEAVTLPQRTFRAEDEDFLFNNVETLTRPAVPDPPQPSVQSNYGVRVLRSYGPVKESPVWDADIPWDTLPGSIKEVLPTYVKAINAPTPITSPITSYIYIEDQGLNIEEFKVEHDTLFPFIVQAANRHVRVIFVVPGTPDPADPSHGRNEHLSLSIKAMIAKIDPDKRENFVMYRVKETIVHSKVMLIDDEFVALGSANFMDRSMEGLDTELHACVVNADLCKELRIKLWAEHLHVDPTNPLVRSELADLTKSLALFGEHWGTGVTFKHDNSALERVPE